MRARFSALLAASMVLGLAGSAATHAQTAGSTADYDAMMEEWQKYMMPGEPHQELSYYVGDWTFVNHMDMAGQTTTSEGSAHVEMMMGGRYLHAMHRSEMMGMPFEGAGITGYDNFTQEYFNVWFDSMGTGVMVSRGKKDADGNLTVRGTMPDPMQGEVSYRMVSTITGKDTYTYEMFASSPDGETRVMEILYTRVKS